MLSDESPPSLASYKTLCMQISRLHVKIKLDNNTNNMTIGDSSNTQIFPRMPIRLIVVKLACVDWNFYYGLVYYAQKYDCFRASLFQFLVNFLISRGLERKILNELAISSSQVIDFDELIVFMKQNRMIPHSHNVRQITTIFSSKNTFLLFNLKPVHMRESNHIIRPW